jgi:hypothetical protein
MSAEDVGALFGVLLVFGAWLACVVFGIRLAKKKNRSPHWMWFGLHPFGALIVLLVMKFIGPLKVCPKCFQKVTALAQVCPYCGYSVASQESSPPPTPATPTDAVDQTTPLFLHISVTRLILMSIVSFSLYEAYWIYKNWRYVKERDNLDIRPFWRGVFGVFFCHSLLRRIYEDKQARSAAVPTFSPGGLATGWVVLIIFANLVAYAPGIGASIVSAFIPSFLCLVPVQNYVNSVNERRSPGQPYYAWSAGHVVCLVFGIITWVLLLIALRAE